MSAAGRSRARRVPAGFSERGTGPSSPLGGMTVALVGPGRVGASVARWLIAYGAVLRSVARARPEPLPRWAAAAGAVASSLPELDSGGLDLLLVAAPDTALPEIAASLAGRPQAAVALHTSGLRTAEVLAPLRAGGTRVGGFHPLRAFPRPLPSPALARRTFVALQGDASAVSLGRRLATVLGAPHAVVPPEARRLYHLAATWAAGGSVTLLGAAVDLQRTAGVDATVAAGMLALAQGALASVEPATLSQGRAAAALTGPLARGEHSYLEQLAALRETSPALHPLAVLLALEAFRQLAAQAPLTPSQEALRSALREVCAQPAFLDPLQARV